MKKIVTGKILQVHQFNFFGRCLFVVLLCLFLFPQDVLSLGFMISELDTLGGNYSAATGINNNGDVVGQAYTPENDSLHAVLYQNGDVVDLGYLKGNQPSAWARDINDIGQITGTSYVSEFGFYDPFIYENGKMTDLGNLGRSRAEGCAINNSGQVVGNSSLGGAARHAFIYKNGEMHDIGTFIGGLSSYAYGINDSSSVVGGSDIVINSQRYFHAFLYDNGMMLDIGTLSGDYRDGSVSKDINNDGIVVGCSGNGTGISRAFIYSEGAMSDLGGFDNSTCALAINNNEKIVGEYRNVNNERRAAYWKEGVGYDLNELIINNDNGWTLTTALDINDLGQVVGYGFLNGETRGYMLTPTDSAPVPEPSTIFLMGIGLLGLVAIKSRKRKS